MTTINKKSTGSREKKCVMSATGVASNENKMSDGWRDGASLRVAGGISWKVWNQSCQSFAPSHG
jgi:hypothetical protein